MFTLWFMGRPASGKSTIAQQVENRLVERGFPIENLDGDNIRQHLHPDLGFSREDRRTNNRRTAYIAKLLNRNDIPVIVGMIAPFRDSQEQAREIIEADADFVLVYVKCSLEEAKRRDPKDLYAQAEDGKIENFTGVNHPFQTPIDPEIVVETETSTVEESVDYVFERLTALGVLDERLDDQYEFDITRSEEEDILSDLREHEQL